jgi:hypothetical protein
MMILVALLLHASQPAPTAAAPPPDIQLNARATARRVVVENRGQTSLTIRTSVNGREGENNVVDVQAPSFRRGGGSSTMSKCGSVPKHAFPILPLPLSQRNPPSRNDVLPP